MKSVVRRDGAVGGQAAEDAGGREREAEALLADAMDNAALKELLEGGLLLQPGHDEIRARGSGTGALNYIVTSITYEFVIYSEWRTIRHRAANLEP
jgi:hypothetical protein